MDATEAFPGKLTDLPKLQALLRRAPTPTRDWYVFLNLCIIFTVYLRITNGWMHLQDNEACYDNREGGHKRYHVNGFHRLALNAPDEALMTVIKNHGPVSVHIFAHFDIFKHYRSGILRNLYPGTTHITHAVAVVGWGNEHGVDYWVLRNSWGPVSTLTNFLYHSYLDLYFFDNLSNSANTATFEWSDTTTTLAWTTTSASPSSTNLFIYISTK